MAEEQQQKALAAIWPSPPPFFSHFTKNNLAQLRRLRREADANDIHDTSSARDESDPNRNLDILALPTELRYLIPPPPPTDDKYRSFGQDVNIHAQPPSLKDLDIEQLYPDDPRIRLNPQPQLIALARSLLTTFLSLVGVLSENPELYESRVNDLKKLVANMHDLINGYRPHQARETVILMMEEKVEKMRAEIKAIDESRERVQGLLRSMRDGAVEASGVHESVEDGTARKVPQRVDRAVRARQRAAWAAIENGL